MSQVEIAQANMKEAFRNDPFARGLIQGAVSTIQKLTEMGIIPDNKKEAE